MPTKVIMPQLGETVVEGTVSKWLKREGEAIQELEGLLDVSTDKVETEIPSPAGGIVLQIVVAEGTTVKAGTILAWIGESGEVPPGTGAGGKGEQAAQPQQAAAITEPATINERELGFISPVVARMAHENNIDLAKIKGTGEGGRITKKDVQAYLERQSGALPEPAAWETPVSGDLFRLPETSVVPESTKTAPEPTTSQAAPPAGGHLVPHTVMRKSIAEHMVQSVHTSPHVTTVMEADMSRVTAHRAANKDRFEQDGIHLTYTPYFVAAVVQALKTYPLANSSWTDEGILLHDEINIGVAASLGEEGLIVPVIKGADGLSLLGIARVVTELAGRARSHHLQPEEVRGGTFTITNHGTSGSLFATPIINQPQAAILGVGAIQKRVVVIQDAIAIRPMVYLALSFDHRILDGDSADGFLAKVVNLLEGWN